jgi:hypothetical protein
MAFSLFKKRRSDHPELHLGETEFCKVIAEDSDNVTPEFAIVTRASHYNILYRDGEYLGIPKPGGGKIYPFSVDPTTKGSNSEKKKFDRAEVVCLAKDYNLKVLWGTAHPFIIADPTDNKKVYSVSTGGLMYVKIDPADEARNCNMFYSQCLSQGNIDGYDIEKLRDFLKEAFVMRVGSKIQKYIKEKGEPLDNYVGLQPDEIESLCEEICPKLIDIFSDYGLTVVQKSSEGSIIDRFIVREDTRNNI